MTIRSFPAVHAIDGPVSFGLEWNGLKFVFSSDSYPNRWFTVYAKDADTAIHECFIAVPDLVQKLKFDPRTALTVGTQINIDRVAFRGRSVPTHYECACFVVDIQICARHSSKVHP